MGIGWGSTWAPSGPWMCLWLDLKSVPPSDRGSPMAWKAEPGLVSFLLSPPTAWGSFAGYNLKLQPSGLRKSTGTESGQVRLDPLCMKLGNILTSLSPCFHIYTVRTVEFTLESCCGDRVAWGITHSNLRSMHRVPNCYSLFLLAEKCPGAITSSPVSQEQQHCRGGWLFSH